MLNGHAAIYRFVTRILLIYVILILYYGELYGCYSYYCKIHKLNIFYN